MGGGAGGGGAAGGGAGGDGVVAAAREMLAPAELVGSDSGAYVVVAGVEKCGTPAYGTPRGVYALQTAISGAGGGFTKPITLP